MIGSPEDISNSVSSSIIRLAPGQDHNLLLTPIFIRFT